MNLSITLYIHNIVHKFYSTNNENKYVMDYAVNSRLFCHIQPGLNYMDCGGILFFVVIFMTKNGRICTKYSLRIGFDGHCINTF